MFLAGQQDKLLVECKTVAVDFTLIGVINMCSVHEVSNEGRSNRSTSTFSVFCSNGTENVSAGMLCSQLSSDRSESLKPEMQRPVDSIHTCKKY